MIRFITQGLNTGYKRLETSFRIEDWKVFQVKLRLSSEENWRCSPFLSSQSHLAQGPISWWEPAQPLPLNDSCNCSCTHPPFGVDTFLVFKNQDLVMLGFSGQRETSHSACRVFVIYLNQTTDEKKALTDFYQNWELKTWASHATVIHFPKIIVQRCRLFNIADTMTTQ